MSYSCSREINGDQFYAGSIIQKEGLFFLIWEHKQIRYRKYPEFLGDNKRTVAIVGLFPDCNIVEYDSASVELRHLVDVILVYHALKQSPTINERRHGSMNYPVSESECVSPLFKDGTPVMCHRCKNEMATTFYGSSKDYPSCQHCCDHLNDEFDREYQ